jgi:hypothetical protein
MGLRADLRAGEAMSPPSAKQAMADYFGEAPAPPADAEEAQSYYGCMLIGFEAAIAVLMAAEESGHFDETWRRLKEQRRERKAQ